jgi:uncharacterized Tic20 family protein
MRQDRDLLDRLGARDPEDNGTSIPVRVKTDPRETAEDALNRAETLEQSGQDIVAEYQQKYYGERDTRRRREHAEQLAGPASHTSFVRSIEWRPRSYTVAGLTDDDRLWAALAHASFLLTIVMSFVTDGWAALALVFAPLALYFSFRDKSDFIAYHALQAFAAQVIGTIGWIAILLVGSLIFAIAIAISGLASIVLIGIPFVILFSLLFVVFVVAMLFVPLAVLILSIAGALYTYSGKDFRYPFIASSIDRQVNSGFVSA